MEESGRMVGFDLPDSAVPLKAKAANGIPKATQQLAKQNKIYGGNLKPNQIKQANYKMSQKQKKAVE